MKKLLSLSLALIMALTSLLVAGSVFADEGKSAKITLTGAAAGSFILEPYEVTVNAKLSDKYAAQIGFDDQTDEPTILDAAIALHLDAIGEDFMSTAPLKVNSSGWVTDFMGKGSSVGYWHNNASASGLTETLKDGDSVYFGFYADPSWGDKYIYATPTSATISVGEEAEIVFTAMYYGSNYALVTEPYEGINVTVDGKNYGKTDKNGKIKVKGTKAGTLKVVAASLDGGYIFPALCKITVVNNSKPASTVKTVKIKKATISKLKKGKKQIKVSWKKLSGVTGYQVQVSTSKKFKKGKNTKTSYVKGAKKTAKTVKKLKAKKKYYVRVRAYKTVKGKKYYGAWSKVKSITTKK